MKRKYSLTIVFVLMLTVLFTSAFTIKAGEPGEFTFGNDLKVKEGEEVDGAAAVLFGNATIDGIVDGELAVIFGNAAVTGTVDGDMAVIFGNAAIDGRVNGNVASIFGNITAGNNAVIGGSAAAVMGQVSKSAGTVIEGEIANIKGPFGNHNINFIPLLGISSLVGLIVFFGLSCLLLVLIPDRMSFMVESAPVKIWRRFGIGIAAYLLFLPAIIALAITVVGLLLIPFFIAAFLLTAFVGMTALELAAGRRITGNLEGRNAQYIYLLVGSILVFILPFIPVLGWLAYIFASCVGLGLVLDSRFGRPRVREIA